MNIPSILRSASNPENVSLFIKSLVTFAILFGFDQTIADQVGNYLADIVIALGMIVSAITGIYGLARKAKLGRWSA